MKKKILICGGGGFIGHHLVKYLKKDNNHVDAVDLKKPRFENSPADNFFINDLRYLDQVKSINLSQYEEIYQLAADMGGAGFVFTGENDSDIMHNSASINLNILHELDRINYKGKIFYSSSACIYPEFNQVDADNPKCSEDSAYPAQPDSEYGWEKLFSERIYLAFKKNKNIDVKIARYHNIFGPLGSWNDGREKAPAAICRKIAEVNNHQNIEIWGTGHQTRSFLYIDDCVEATVKLTRSDKTGPYNIGSERKISIRDLVKIVSTIAEKEVTIKTVKGPVGVNGRNSDNLLVEKDIGWNEKVTLEDGLTKTYDWISKQIKS